MLAELLASSIIKLTEKDIVLEVGKICRLALRQ